MAPRSRSGGPSTYGVGGSPGREQGRPPDLAGVEGAGGRVEDDRGGEGAVDAGVRVGPEAPVDAGRAVSQDAAEPPDVPASPADCVLGAFGAPSLVAGLGLDPALNLWGPTLSSDGLSLYFSGEGGGADEDLYVASRPDLSAGFGAATPLAGINTNAGEGAPFVTTDDLTLYFYSTRAGGSGSRDLWRAARSGAGDAFANPEPLDEINTSSVEHLPWLSDDARTLLFVSTRNGGAGSADIWQATRSSAQGDFEEVANVSSLNSELAEGRAQLTADGRVAFFVSARPGGLGGLDLWTATRPNGASDFEAIQNLSALNSAAIDANLSLSPNERELFFASTRSGPTRLLRAVRDCE